jgi:hypothetical protein
MRAHLRTQPVLSNYAWDSMNSAYPLGFDNYAYNPMAGACLQDSVNYVRNPMDYHQDLETYG